jgi:putative acetyltransferase
MIRKAEKEDISRIAEILVFVKRMKYRPIFQNDDYSFGELQVIRVSQEYDKQEILDNMWVYDDGIVKGMIHIVGDEVVELYVDYFFWEQGVGSKLLEFAKEKFGVCFLWALEKNYDAIRFYKAHGFHDSGERKLEEGTTEYLIKMEL